jgi:hypothetical protein
VRQYWQPRFVIDVAHAIVHVGRTTHPQCPRCRWD